MRQDLRIALRSWAKSPSFTLIAVASIALGIGVTTAIFTLVDQVLLRRLPVQDPHELVQIIRDCPSNCLEHPEDRPKAEGFTWVAAGWL